MWNLFPSLPRVPLLVSSLPLLYHASSRHPSSLSPPPSIFFPLSLFLRFLTLRKARDVCFPSVASVPPTQHHTTCTLTDNELGVEGGEAIAQALLNLPALTQLELGGELYHVCVNEVFTKQWEHLH